MVRLQTARVDSLSYVFFFSSPEPVEMEGRAEFLTLRGFALSSIRHPEERLKRPIQNPIRSIKCSIYVIEYIDNILQFIFI